MNPSDGVEDANKLNEWSLSFAVLREKIIDEWALAVSEAIPAAAELRRPILTNTLPILYGDITEALANGQPRAPGTSGTNLGLSHGRERATLSHYSVEDLVHELQIFRKVVFSVTRREKIELNFERREIVNQSIDNCIRESLLAFSKARHELEQLMFVSLSHDLRIPL